MENEKQQPFFELTSAVEKYLISLAYSQARISTFQKGWNLIKQFIDDQSAENYNAKIGDAFIESILGKKEYSSLSHKEKDIIRSANVLTDIKTTGMITFRAKSKSYEFKGEVGNLILQYLQNRKSNGATEDTINAHKLYLHRFIGYLNSNHALSLSSIDKEHILGFIYTLEVYTKSTIHCTLCSLRCFLRYLFENQYLDGNLDYLVPNSSYKKEAHLPTTYTKDEVELLINAVDRSNPKGKRDVAMILVAARLGLRASDICRLKFENINWETNTIRLIQKKTQEKIELPLLTDIGNAIIDYLKYGRPLSDLPYIFIRAGQPYDRLEEPTLHSIVSFYLKRAGIDNIANKKHGPHALRHSLAGILLEKKTPLPVISEVLGHTNTESTKSYLRIDLDSLRQCALDVLPLKSPHYQEVNA
jgi:integrase/recombinase XerD